MKKRIFIGINISEQARTKIAEYSKDLRNQFPDVKAGWVQPESFHLTLKFFGEVQIEQLPLIADSTANVAKRFTPFSLATGKTGVFPNGRNPRVIWLGITDLESRTDKIARDLASESKNLGFEPDFRTYFPHLTIARLRDSVRSAELVKIHLGEEIEPVEFRVSEIIIFESKLKSTGSEYIPIKKIAI